MKKKVYGKSIVHSAMAYIKKLREMSNDLQTVRPVLPETRIMTVTEKEYWEKKISEFMERQKK